MNRRNFLKLFGSTIYLPLIIKSGVQPANVPVNYFVSQSGSDSNNGKSEQAAFQTIARLLQEPISAGDTINLAQGSRWREQLSIPANNVTIRAYGCGGERPLLDCSNVIPNLSFIKTIGYSNVYQVAITPGWGSGNDFVNVWEADVVMPKAASLASLDSSPGKCFWSGLSGTITLYIHPAGSPITNGKTYEYSHRSHGLNSFSFTGVTVDGIWTRRNLNFGGSLRLGANSTAVNCRASEGNSHNFYMKAGSSAIDCTFDDFYHTAASTLAVYNADSPNGESITFQGCTFRVSSVNIPNWFIVAGVNGHRNVSGNFGTVALTDCTFENLHIAISSLGNCTAIRVTNPTFINCKYGLSAPFEAGPGCTYLINGGSWASNISYHRFVDAGYSTTPITVDGTTIQVSAPTDTGYIRSTVGAPLTVQNCTFIAGSSGLTAGIFAGNPSANLTLRNNEFQGNWQYFYYFTAGAQGMTWVSDDNTFQTFNKMFIFGTFYNSLAAYQAATGQDAHSA